MELYQIVFLILVAAIAVIYFIQKFTGVSLLEKIVQWRPVIAALTAQVKAASEVLPSPYFKTVTIVLDAAAEATKKAEDMWLLGRLPKEDRNQYAQILISESLTEAGIEVTEQVQQIVDGCIAIICMLMPHSIESQE